MSARVVAPGCFVLGLVLLIPFEKAYTIALGVAFLLAFVAVGSYALAGPEGAARFEEAEGRDDDGSRPG